VKDALASLGLDQQGASKIHRRDSAEIATFKSASPSSHRSKKSRFHTPLNTQRMAVLMLH
jgi:hypothetical protein